MFKSNLKTVKITFIMLKITLKHIKINFHNNSKNDKSDSNRFKITFKHTLKIIPRICNWKKGDDGTTKFFPVRMLFQVNSFP